MEPSLFSTPKILYIIGNGFDLHHEIESRYTDFQEYVFKEDQHLFLVANEYLFNDIDEWNNFENSLGEINPNTINDIEADEHLKWEEEDFSEKNIHSFTDAISWNLEFIREGLNRLFPKWISKAYIPTTEEARELLLQLIPEAKFITFNYTNTLEKVYHIPKDNILHLHGTTKNPIYGHGAINVTEFTGEEWTPTDELQSDVELFFNNTRKDVLSIIDQNRDFLQSLHDVEIIYVIGHSMNDIDLPYFEEIIDTINTNTQWVVSFYNSQDKLKLESQIKKSGIGSYKTVHIEDLIKGTE